MAVRSMEDVLHYSPNGSWCIGSFAAWLVTALVALRGVLHISRFPDAHPAVCFCSLRSLERCLVLVSLAKSLTTSVVKQMFESVVKQNSM